MSSTKKRIIQIINKLENNTISESMADVTAMEKTMNTNPTLKDRNSRINNAYEFKSAFEAWFETLGLEPDKITLPKIKADIDEVLRRKGYK